MYKRYLFSIIAAIGLTLASPSDAKKAKIANIDFGTLTCREFISEIQDANKEDVGAVLLWLDGYLSGLTGDTELNWKKLEIMTERLVESCKERGKDNLLDVVRQVGTD